MGLKRTTVLSKRLPYPASAWHIFHHCAVADAPFNAQPIRVLSLILYYIWLEGSWTYLSILLQPELVSFDASLHPD